MGALDVGGCAAARAVVWSAQASVVRVCWRGGSEAERCAASVACMEPKGKFFFPPPDPLDLIYRPWSIRHHPWHVPWPAEPMVIRSPHTVHVY